MITLTKPCTPSVSWAVPEELGIPPDPLRLRLDFHHQAVVLTLFSGDGVETKIVSAMDVAHALATDLAFSTGLLPAGTLWWRNTREGPVHALYVEGKVRTLALQLDANQPPLRFKIPLPGLIFLCRPGKPPWVYAVKKKPAKESDEVFKAPMCNVFESGLSCPGSHTYPPTVEEVPESFLISFFSATGDLQNRSRMFPNSVVKLWQFLDKKKAYPLDDLIPHGRVADLMEIELY